MWVRIGTSSATATSASGASRSVWSSAKPWPCGISSPIPRSPAPTARSASRTAAAPAVGWTAAKPSDAAGVAAHDLDQVVVLLDAERVVGPAPAAGDRDVEAAAVELGQQVLGRGQSRAGVLVELPEVGVAREEAVALLDDLGREDVGVGVDLHGGGVGAWAS